MSTTPCASHLVIKGDSIPGAEVTTHFETPLAKAGSESQEVPLINGIFFLNPDSRGYAVPDLSCAPVNLPPDAPPGAPGLTWALGSLDPSITQPIYRQFVDQQSPFLREFGVQGMILANDPEGVKSAVGITTASPLVADALQGYTNPDPSGVAALSKIALSDPGAKEPIMQRSALFALTMIHTKDALPALAVLLDSKDQGLQCQAIAGFCQFAPNPETGHYCQGLDLTIDISFWKSWWACIRCRSLHHDRSPNLCSPRADGDRYRHRSPLRRSGRNHGVDLQQSQQSARHRTGILHRGRRAADRYCR